MCPYRLNLVVMLECPSRSCTSSHAPLRRSVASRTCAAGRGTSALAWQPAAPPWPDRIRAASTPCGNRLAAGRVEHHVLRGCAGSGLCQVLGQHVAQPAGQADRPGLAVLGRADLAPMRVHRGRGRRRAGHVPLDSLAHVQHATRRVYVLRRSAHGLPGRSAVEREFGRLKNEWARSPLRVRGLDRVRLRADLTILAKPARTRAVPLAAKRVSNDPRISFLNRRLRGVGRAG
jgi:hypothetical protein